MVVFHIIILIFVLILKPEIQAAVVHFNFSTPELVISEGGDLPSQLFINKVGQHQGNITVDISLTSTVPNDGDYIVSPDPYVFTNETFSLPIGIQLITDRSGEDIETFDLTLTLPQQSTSADIVFPGRVTVIIIDDDSVVIGFSNDNSSVTIIEGDPTQTICLEVKDEGLRLDPFDTVQINIKIDPEIPGTPVQLNTSQLVFQRTLMRCATISTQDNRISEGTRSANIVISGNMDSNVPIELFPSKIPLTILDNDEITFNISSNAIIVASEGERIIRIIRFLIIGNTSLTYNVTLEVNALTSSTSFDHLSIPMELIFHPSTYEIDVAVEIDVPDDSVFSEERKEFSTSILVGAINATGTLTSVVGGPIEIAVYDNDFEVGFTENRTNITEGLCRNVCVRIFDLNSEDIDPTKLLLLELLLSPDANGGTGAVELTMNQVVLNALSPVVCFDVTLSTSGAFNDMTSFTIQLIIPSNQNNNYNIKFRQQLIVIDVLRQQSVTMTIPSSQGLGSSGVAAVTVLCILLIPSIAINITMIIIFVIMRMKIRKDDRGGAQADNYDDVRVSTFSKPPPKYENVNLQRRTSQGNPLISSDKNSSTSNLVY